MHIDVIPSVNEARAIDLTHRTVIVIDVLRATSTIVTALQYGASGVIPVETVSQAKQIAKDQDVLAGERFCKKISGFDAGNSPYEYMSNSIEGKRIVLTTSNGTRAIQKALKADYILAGAIINAQATAHVACKLRKDVALLCSGAQDEFAFEDGLCAGLIIAELHRCMGNANELTMNDVGYTVHSSYQYYANRIPEALQQCSGGKKLCKLGFAKDVEFCATVNTYSLVPILTDNHTMKPFSST